MHGDLIDEVLRWCPRNQLDRIQLQSPVLRDRIAALSGALPRHTIGHVDMGFGRRGRIQFEVIPHWDRPWNGSDDHPPPVFEASMHHGDFEAILLRLKHTVVRVIRCYVADSAFLKRFMEKAKDMDVVVKHILFRLPGPPTDDDKALGHSIVNALQPSSYDGLTQGVRRWI